MVGGSDREKKETEMLRARVGAMSVGHKKGLIQQTEVISLFLYIVFVNPNWIIHD